VAGLPARNTASGWPGNFFVVLNSITSMDPMKITGTGYLGYNPEDKVYTYHEFSSDGETVDARGTVDGDTWTWTSEEEDAGQGHERTVHREDHLADLL
jgi:hypothetical protein